MNDLLHQAGFLGTSANFAADMTLVLMLLVAALFTYGAYLAAVKKQYEKHRVVQTIGAILNIILVGWMMVLPFRDFIVRDQGAPQAAIFYAITMVHAAFGVSGIVFGWFVVLRGNNLMPIKALRFNNYKPYMRLAYALYMIATILGVIVYVIWFAVNPNPPHYG